MTRKIPAPAFVAMMALAGCNLTRSDQRRKPDQVTATVFNVNAQRPGRLIEPRYCKIDSAILTRPVGDPVVESSAWNVADEQIVPVDVRQALEANGLRVGVITGTLPGDIVEAFKPRPPIKETQWVHLALPEGEHSPIVLGGKTETVSLLLNHRGNKIDGRDYQGASGRLNITPSHQGLTGVSVRVVPEIHHGAERRTIAPVQNNGPFAQHEFGIKDGQQEDVLRELATTVDLQPGQTLVIGCRGKLGRTLGTFLFLQPEPTTDQMLQSILLLQAARNSVGVPPLKPIEDEPDAHDPAVRASAEAAKGSRPARETPGL